MATDEQQDIEYQQAFDLLKGFFIPPQPKIMTAIREVIPDTGKMVDLINRDPSIAGAILKVVNSAAFHKKQTISSVQHAVILLGHNSVVNILNAICLRKALISDDNIYLDKFWLSTSKVAIAMSSIVRQLNLSSPQCITVDEAYAAGLFHHCGMPVIYQKFNHYFEVIQKAYQLGNLKLIETENENFDTNHSVLGYFITKSWKMPAVICDVIRNHHDINVLLKINELDAKTALLLAILKISEKIVDEALEFGCHLDFEWEKIDLLMLNELELTESDYEELRDIVLDVVYRSSQQLN